jgi:hypothetical protein
MVLLLPPDGRNQQVGGPGALLLPPDGNELLAPRSARAEVPVIW